MARSKGLYVILVSIHGLIRGENLELGRDADTGGQTKYVVELARALAKHPHVERVDLVTRMVIDPKVSADYAKPVEPLGDNAQIIRLPCGPRRYLRKEVLWAYLDSFADELLRHLRQVGRLPDVIHSHYADAGYVGCRIAGWLGVPLIHTGHSLGRVKLQRLIEHGTKPDVIEEHFRISTRIEAEEATLGSAALVIASTHQEVEQQYSIYDQYQPHRMTVIPPGVTLQRFYPPDADWQAGNIRPMLSRFFKEPDKPLIMALSRPAMRKNVASLVKAYGEDPELQKLANLLLILGNRDDIGGMESGPRQVMTDLLLLIDYYDLYGKVAYPKQHQSDDVPNFYRYATQTQGVFINPALTEPFGLTLIEATACGLPIVATADGGPRDITAACQNGILINPLDIQDIQTALRTVLSDSEKWHRWSKNGIHHVKENFSWTSHVERYLEQINKLPYRPVQSMLSPLAEAPAIEPLTEPFTISVRSGTSDFTKNRLPIADRILVCEIDDTLIGDRDALRVLMDRLNSCEEAICFGIATGRNLASAIAVLEEWQIPMPDLLVTSVGSEIYHGPQVVTDTNWQRHISYRWRPDAVREAMNTLPGLTMQPPEVQGRYKISYFVDEAKAPSIREMLRFLRQQHLHVKAIYSHSMYLDLVPLRASKGDALRYCALKWGLPIQKFYAAGACGNDEAMLAGNTMGIVVSNYSEELERLRDRPQIYFAQGHHAWGILEGLEHYGFFEQPSKKPPQFIKAGDRQTIGYPIGVAN
ncbi:MAG: HAD family hydrolase [Elainellaceae cyanobacterium]